MLNRKLYGFLLIIFFTTAACNSDKPKNDVDINDKDSGLTDIDTPVQDPDTVEIDTEQPDIDADADTNVPCLDLRYNENTIKTNFPFKDKNEKPTFCRPGCDIPTETDPQCVRNIWEWDNWSEYQVYLEAEKKNPNQELERECFPWPCKLPDMKANSTLESFNSKCDRWLTVKGFKASEGTIWSHGMSDGVAGMDFGHTGRAIEYDPEKDEYSTLGQNRYLSFNEGRYVIEVYDRVPGDNVGTYKVFTVSIMKKDEKYYYEFIYDSGSAYEEFTGPAFAGEKWVLIQIGNRTTGKESFKYASSKNWQWHNIEGIQNYAGEGNIVGDHLTFITNNREIYYCDLRKYPKHINDCKEINRLNTDGITYELGHSPMIDSENENRLVYNVYGENKFVEVILTDIDKPEYVEYEVAKHMENAEYWGPSKLQGKLAIYIESDPYDDIGCFYRFDKKKSYCPAENIFSTSPDNLMGFNTFWGKWHLWKGIGRTAAFMRDWECYCKETGVCPFDE
ncbi:MAG TPA: hypothetical protein PK560_07820 [bacterium]|jgi:hypothetical protein|nr:hypothetical protein [bacterium]HOG43972.1 hypothetical protein [bacterium]